MYYCALFALAVMRILSLSTSSHNGGAAIVASNLAICMRRMGYEIDFVSQDTLRSSLKLPLNRKILQLYYKARRLPARVLEYLDSSKSPIYSSYSLFPSRINSLIKATSPDLIHLHWVQGEFISIDQISSIRLPIVWTLHDAWPLTLNSKHHILESALDPQKINSASTGLLSRIMARRKKTAICKSNITFVAPSQWMNDLVQASEICRETAVKVIPNGIDLNVFRRLPVSDCFILDANQGYSRHLVLLISSLASVKDPVKGFDIFLDSIRILYQQGYRITLVTLGRSSNISLAYARVINIGIISDPVKLAKVYNSVDVTCIPSRIETHTQTGCESIACGTPVAAFRTAGNPSIVHDGKTGYLAEAYSSSSFADTILKCKVLSDSSYTRENIAKHAACWDIEAVSQDYISLYQQILSRGT